MSGARVRFSGDATDLVRAQEDVARGAKKMEESFDAAGREAKRLERIATKAFRESATDQEKAERKAKDLTKAWKEGYLSTQLYNREIAKMRSHLYSAGEAQEKVTQGPSKMVAAVSSVAAGYVSISNTLSTILQQQENWSRNQSQIASEASRAALDVVAFAALQDDSSVIRQRTMQAIQAGAGVASSGQSLNLVQSMQSAFGFDKGLEVSRDIFKTVQTGVPIDVATILAQAAAGQQQDPARFVRSAFAAGQVSSKDPGVIGRAAAELAGFEDKDFGWLVAAQGSSNYAGQLPTYTQNIGMALSGVSNLKDRFKKLGVLDGATREERLRALAAAGLNTTEKLVGAGLTEKTQARFLADLVSSVESGSFDRMSTQFSGLMANKNLIVDKREMIERALPETQLQRMIAEVEAGTAQRRQFGAKPLSALREEYYKKALADALESRGLQSSYGRQLYEMGDDGKSELNMNSINFLGYSGLDPGVFAAIQEATRRTADALQTIKGNMNPVTVTTQEK